MRMLGRDQTTIWPDMHRHQQHQRVEVASRPASPAPRESKRLGAPTNRTFVPKSFGRNAGKLRALEKAVHGASTAALIQAAAVHRIDWCLDKVHHEREPSLGVVDNTGE